MTDTPVESAEDPRTRCSVCEQEQATSADWGKRLPVNLCWASVGAMSHAQRDCYRRGYELARAALAARDAEWRKASRAVQTCDGPCCAPLRALLSEGKPGK